MRSFHRATHSAARIAYLIVLVTALLAPPPATGSEPQAAAHVLIDPTAAVTRVGETVTVDIYLDSVTDLWAGQVAVHFDPTILQVVDAAGALATKIQRGTLLNPARVSEIVNVADNSAGRIEYAATLRNDPRNPVPAASGSGSFARILFKGIAEGTSPVTFSVEGADFIHEQLFVQLIGGSLQQLVLPTGDGSVTVQSGYRIYLPLALRNTTTAASDQVAPADEGAPPVPGLVSPEPAPAEAAPVQPEAAQRQWPEGWLKAPPPERWSAPPTALDTPELYVSALNGTSMALAGNMLYFVQQSGLEFCNTNSPNQIRSVNTTNHAEATLYSGCDRWPGVLVADANYVYFQDRQSNTVRRMPAGGGSSTALANTTGLSSHIGLAVDATHLYFDDHGGLKRVPIAGGSVQTLVTGYNPDMIALDDTYVYWTESSKNLTDLGAIRRVLKTGGAVQTLLSTPDVNDPGSLAVDGTNIYWVEYGGRARRMPKGGGTPTDYNAPDSAYIGGYVAINAANLYWSDSLSATSGRLRRAPKGGGTVNDLVLGGVFTPMSVGLTSTHVYWVAVNGVYRLPLAAEPVRVDLSMTGMEVTQGIQNMANDVPLVAEKTTYVRVYPAVDLADTPHVKMWLRGFSGGFELSGSPIQPVWPELLVDKEGGHREHMADSFLFYLPKSWRNGTVELRAEINPGTVIPESDTGNNTLSRTVSFTPKAPVCVVFVPVRTHGSPASTDMPGFFSIIGRFVSLWPIPDIRGYTQDEDIAFQGLSGNEPYTLPDDNNWVISKLWWRSMFSNPPCDQTYYVGMVSADTDTGGTLGYGSYISHDAWVKMEAGTIPGYFGHPWYESRGGFTMAHEMSHNHNGWPGDRWKHVDCPKGGVPDLTSVYPTNYDSCYLDVPGPANHYGFDPWIDPHSIIPPESAADYMSYADAPWVSDYNYKGMFNELDNAAAAGVSQAPPALVALAEAAEYLLVSGAITPTLNTARLDPGYRITEALAPGTKLSALLAQQTLAAASGAAAEYTFQLVDAGGTPLYTQLFDPEPAIVPDPGTAPDPVQLFHLGATWNPSTAQVRILKGATVLAALDVSPNTPQVTVVQPNGGNVVGDSLTIQWTGSDADSDRLFYAVQYSPDNGATWRAVATDLLDTSLTLNTTQGLPASTQALIRVIATDGVNTTTDVSNAVFAVQNHAPKPHIDSPRDGAVYAPGQQIPLRGGAFDAEGTEIAGDNLQWLVDGAPADYGAEAVASNLPAGPHTITLQASDGVATAEAQVQITVQELACAANNKLDVVFLLDTSPDMESHAAEACTNILYTVWGLTGAGYQVNPKVLGMTQAGACASSSVASTMPGGMVDNPADWGAGVTEVAGRYDWQPGAIRLIVPVSNAGPAGGDTVQDPGADREAINAAIAAAQLNHVAIAPLIMPPYDEAQRAAIVSLAAELAASTGGRVYQTGDPTMTIYSDLPNVARAVACAPKLHGISPSCGISQETTLTLFGENLAAGTQLYIGGGLVSGATPNEDGTRATFHIPAELGTGRTYDVRAELPGAGSDTLHGAITLGTCDQRCDGYQPGDVVAPMWILRDGEMTFQAKASGSSLRVTLYAADSLTKLTIADQGGSPIDSIQISTDQTGSLSATVTSGQIYQVTVLARRPGARFRLMARGAEWLRLPDDGDGWTGGFLPGAGENNGTESSAELGYSVRWSDTPATFADTTWYFNVVSGDATFESAACVESPYGDAERSTRWTDPSGQFRAATWGAGNVVGCSSLSAPSPLPGFWGMQLLADPPYSPGPQQYMVTKPGAGADDWIYLRQSSMAGPPCGPSVILDPVGGSFCQDKVFRMDIVVADVADLYGAEVHATFDPTRLEAVDQQGSPVYEVEPGPLLDPANGLIGANSVDNSGGYIDYAISLKDPASSAFGGGVLATVYFRAKATGSATVQFDLVKLSTKPQPPQPGAAIPAVTQDATFTLNTCAQTGAMGGRVYLDGRAVHAGAGVVANPNGHVALSVPDGTFELPALAAASYSVDITRTSYLRAGPRSFAVATGSTLNLGNVTLLGGDCDGDDKINIMDAAMVAFSFAVTSSGAGFEPRADINGDGVVDIYDLVLVGNNFGCALADTTARCQRWGRP